MSVEWSEALPILVSTGVALALLGFDRALVHQTELYYKNSTTLHAQPNMVRHFTTWWMDLTSLAGAGLASLASGVLHEEAGARVTIVGIGATYLLAATLAALRYPPFEYPQRFRVLRWVVARYNKSAKPTKQIRLWRPRTSPAFPLVISGNAIALLFAINL